MMDRERVLVACAQAAHEANQAYCAAIGDAPSPAWDGLTNAQREGVIAGARHTLAGGTQRESHELWVASRVDEGWTYGPVKDFAAKTSPNLVPYDALPEAQRRKDDLFQAIVRAMATAFED